MLLTKILSTYIVRIHAKETSRCDFKCSLVYDPVCGIMETGVKSYSINKYQNLCTLLLVQCHIGSSEKVVRQVPDELCGIRKPKVKSVYRSGRRDADFGIVGAHQTCNHTCPIYCTDAYEPACAAILNDHGYVQVYRPMLNHCHVDLFSCSMGLQVRIEAMGRCYLNPSNLTFMSQVAGMKSLGLLDE